jgi:hypothetical protein
VYLFKGRDLKYSSDPQIVLSLHLSLLSNQESRLHVFSSSNSEEKKLFTDIISKLWDSNNRNSPIYSEHTSFDTRGAKFLTPVFGVHYYKYYTEASYCV